MPNHISKTYTLSETATLLGATEVQIVAAMPKCGIRFAKRRNQKLQQSEVNDLRRYLAR